MKDKYSFRKIVNVLHLWIGLPSALILFIVCVTGTLYVFQKEITKIIDHKKYEISVPSNNIKLNIDTLVRLTESHNKGFILSSIQIPDAKNEAWLFTITPSSKKDTKISKTEIKRRTKNFLINPYTNSVLGTYQSATTRFFDKIISLHRWLLMDHSIGAIITISAAFLFLILEISGIILWLPSKIKNWKKWSYWKTGFFIKKHSSLKRRNYDLHKVLGFYTFFLITIMSITGPYFGADWYKNVFKRTLGVEIAKDETKNKNTKKDKKQSDYSISLDSSIVLTNCLLSYNGEIKINLSQRKKGNISIQKSHTGFCAFAGLDEIDFSSINGRITNIDLFSRKNLGEKLITVIRDIHTGNIYGIFSKLLYFIACLIATSLPITGIIIWFNKRKSVKK